MSVVYVQFKDEEKAVIVSVFASPADPEYYKYLGEVEDDDERLVAFWALFPEHNRVKT